MKINTQILQALKETQTDDLKDQVLKIRDEFLPLVDKVSGLEYDGKNRLQYQTKNITAIIFLPPVNEAYPYFTIRVFTKFDNKACTGLGAEDLYMLYEFSRSIQRTTDKEINIAKKLLTDKSYIEGMQKGADIINEKIKKLIK